MVDAEHKGLSLEALANRLEALQREHAEKLEALERENAELRSKVAQLEGLDTSERDMESPPEAYEHEAPAFEGRLSRRSLLGKAAAAAVGTVAAGAVLARDASVAKADHGFTNTINARRINVDTVRAIDSTADITLVATARHTAIWARSQRLDNLGTGVFGLSDGSGRGVSGNCKKGIGVYGTGQTGVLGEASGLFGPGVSGQNPNAVGVSGKGKIGVSGVSSAAGGVAVHGRHIGTGGIGVRGDGPNDGYGGRFQGGKAQLRLVPSSSTGRPTTGTHNQGEIYMDSNSNLFVCAVGGTPGTWNQISIVG